MNRTHAQRTRLIRYRTIAPPPWRKSLYGSYNAGRRPGFRIGALRSLLLRLPFSLLQSDLAEVDLVDGRLDDRLRVDARGEELAVVPVVDPRNRSPLGHDRVVQLAVGRVALRATQLGGIVHQLVRSRVVEVGRVVVLHVLNRLTRKELVDVVVRIREVSGPPDEREVVVVPLLAERREQTALEGLRVDVGEADRVQLRSAQPLDQRPQGGGRVPVVHVAGVAVGEGLRLRDVLLVQRIRRALLVAGDCRRQERALRVTGPWATDLHKRLPVDAVLNSLARVQVRERALGGVHRGVIHDRRRGGAGATPPAG